MNTQSNAHPRAAAGILGARAGRRHLTRTAVLARQLDEIAPGAVHVRTVPVTVTRNGERHLATWVQLTDVHGLPVGDQAAHRAAFGLLDRLMPGTDWSHPRAYDAATGALTLDEPNLPEELRQ
ncbi:hypothetical protein ACFC63_07840 [Streptomyces albidoflavus]